MTPTTRGAALAVRSASPRCPPGQSGRDWLSDDDLDDDRARLAEHLTPRRGWDGRLWWPTDELRRSSDDDE